MARISSMPASTSELRIITSRAAMTRWLKSGELKNVEYRLQGIENVGRAFCDLFGGNNFGKTIVRLRDEQ